MNASESHLVDPDILKIVVVGNQSSGKSSTLEGLTGLPFPKNAKLCTRFATKIIFRRTPEKSVHVSIEHGCHADAQYKAKLRAWAKPNLPELSPEAFANLIEEAHGVMGLPSKERVFSFLNYSEDVLRIEVCGPEEEHLSIIDTPGIFKNAVQGLTTSEDVETVQQLVSKYMENPRSIILAVAVANVDVANEEILQMARKYDPDGSRTVGVLTKPDIIDKGAEEATMDIIEGKAHHLALGWLLLRNLGQAESLDPTLTRNASEDRFFRSQVPWNSLPPESVGIKALRTRLRGILGKHLKQEFPKVQVDLNRRLWQCKATLTSMGPKRETQGSQLQFLLEVAMRFQTITNLAIKADYAGDDIFLGKSSLKIATAVVERDQILSESFEQIGHTYRFEDEPDADDDVIRKREQWRTTNQESPVSPDIQTIITAEKRTELPKSQGITDWLFQIYSSSRGFELGSFDPSLLSIAMKAQSNPWHNLAHSYMNDIVAVTHQFIQTLLRELCPDEKVLHNLKHVLMDGLVHRYRKAYQQVDFILQVEQFGIPGTLNKDFLHQLREFRVISRPDTPPSTDNGSRNKTSSASVDNPGQVAQDIHHLLKSYYTVARKRAVDNICMQAARHHLILGPDTPLKLFSPTFVGKLSAEQLERIAGEDESVRQKRVQLEEQIAKLEEGRRIIS